MNDFQRKLIQWYNLNKRDLPWRQTLDPYRIWVSEIILQQTRVDQGLAYYERFIARFPDVRQLAEADEQEVLSVWKGLGYYSRARNMHHTARSVVQEHAGVFPGSYYQLLRLKGIGKYTAAAIASICSYEPVPVVDGNVVRVFSRLFGFGAAAGTTASFNKVWERSSALIDRDDPGTYNQAVMEFGALCCKPANPGCGQCIFRNDCFAFGNQMVDKLPLKKKELTKRERWFTYLYVPVGGGKVLMQQRPQGDIWHNLWELPLIEADHLLGQAEVSAHPVVNQGRERPEIIVVNPKDYRHILTHQIIHARFYEISGYQTGEAFEAFEAGDYRVMEDPLVTGLPVSRLTDRYLHWRAGNMQGL